MACRDVWNIWPSGLRSPQNPPASPSGFVVTGGPRAMYFTHHGKPWLKPIIWHSTGRTGRHEVACSRADRTHRCWTRLQYQPRQDRPYMWSISILPRSSCHEKTDELAFLTCSCTVHTHLRLRNDAYQRDSQWRYNNGKWRHSEQVTNHERDFKRRIWLQ